MVRSKEQNERMSHVTREKITEAALSLFAYKGYALTTIKDVSKTAGISTGLIYRHFHSKEELFDTLIEMAIIEIKELINFLDTDINPKDMINSLVEKIIAGIESSELIAHYYLLVSRSFIDNDVTKQQENLKTINLILFQKMSNLIEKGQQLGELKEGNADKLSLLFFSLTQGIASMKLFLEDKFIALESQDLTVFLINEEKGEEYV